MIGNTILRAVAGRGSGSDVAIAWPLSRYDLVLALIPLAFGVAIFASLLLEVTLPTAMAAASVLGLGMILDATFRNPPVPTATPTSGDRSIEE